MRAVSPAVVPPRHPAPTGRRRATRTLWRTGSAAAGAAAVSAGAAGWLASRALTRTPSSPTRWPVLVTAVHDGAVTIAGPGAALEGTWGLWWPDGYARMEPVGPGEPKHVRTLAWAEGYLRPGMRAAMCAYAWPNRPQSLGAPWAEVLLESAPRPAARRRDPRQVQPRAAWRFGAADSADWVIFVHGRGGLRAQSFRALARVLAVGWTGLAITYRGAIEAGGGRNDLGADEWADLEDAVRFARAAGAQRIVLAGFSMGGAIVSELLHRSPLAGAVSGVVLDAPVLDWARVLHFHARRMRLPRAIVPVALTAVHLRAGRDPRLLDQLRRTMDWTTPALLVHGTDDAVVPVTSSDLLAEARPDIVRYLRVARAGHVTSWNTDPNGYESALTDFLLALP
jgi:uncharacterized protein